MLKPHPALESTHSLLGLEQLITEPTHITPTSETLLDHIYTNKPNSVRNASVDHIGISDHSGVHCVCSFSTPKIKKGGHTFITYRSFKNFDNGNFLFDLSCAPFHLVYNEADPDRALAAWYDIFLGVLNRHASLRRKRVKYESVPPWLTHNIIQEMYIRDTLRREKRFAEYKQQRNRVRLLVRKAKAMYVDNMIKQDKSVSTLWRAMTVATGGSEKKPNVIPSHLTADHFNNHFLSVAETLAPSKTNTEPYVCSDKLIDYCKPRSQIRDAFVIPHVTVFDVGKIISAMPNKKSSGPDEISPKILKLSLPFVVDTLTYIYNRCISSNTFPSELKMAKVIPIPKTKELNDVNNYRPISLLSVLSKPLERHVHKHVTQYLEDHQLIYPLQSGFRANHSCPTALTRIVDTWLSAVNKGLMTGAIFIDLSKAFDLVDHNILLRKLNLYLSGWDFNVREQRFLPHIANNTLQFFQSYLINRHQSVMVNGLNSSHGLVNRGVPQGSVLGPLLFSIFINDLPLHISDASVTCDMFADDATIHTPDLSISSVNKRLQQSLRDVSRWCEKNSMVLNPLKTECMLIATRQKLQLKPLALNLTINDHPIKQVTEHRLLGLIIDSQLSWKAHIDQLCKLIARNVFLLSKLKFMVDIDARQLYFNAHIKSHLDYVSNVWDGSSESNLKRLNSLHRRAVKQILPDQSLTTDQKLKSLNILPLDKHLLFNKGVLMYKVWNELCPEYICRLLSKSVSKYSTCRKTYIIPHTRLDLYKTSLAFSGATLWNSLPLNITHSRSLSAFKKDLYKYLMHSDHH